MTPAGDLEPISLNGVNICDETAQSGTFLFDVPVADPNGTGNTDLRLIAKAENQYIEIYENINNLSTASIQDDVTNTVPSTGSLNVGTFDISTIQYQSVPIQHRHFWAVDKLTDIRDWYDDNLNSNPRTLKAYYDVNACDPPQVDPSSHYMDLSHTTWIHDYDGNAVKNCEDNLISPLDHDDTLAHEYAHFVFYETCDDYD